MFYNRFGHLAQYICLFSRIVMDDKHLPGVILISMLTTQELKSLLINEPVPIATKNDSLKKVGNYLRHDFRITCQALRANLICIDRINFTLSLPKVLRDNARFSITEESDDPNITPSDLPILRLTSTHVGELAISIILFHFHSKCLRFVCSIETRRRRQKVQPIDGKIPSTEVGVPKQWSLLECTFPEENSKRQKFYDDHFRKTKSLYIDKLKAHDVHQQYLQETSKRSSSSSIASRGSKRQKT